MTLSYRFDIDFIDFIDSDRCRLDQFAIYSLLDMGITVIWHDYDFAFDQNMDGNDKGHSGAWTPNALLTAALETLFGFRSGTNVKLTLEIAKKWLPEGQSREEWAWEQMMPLIFPVVRRLTAAGTRASIYLGRSRPLMMAKTGQEIFQELKDDVYKNKGGEVHLSSSEELDRPSLQDW